jgi:hypothetical protein
VAAVVAGEPGAVGGGDDMCGEGGHVGRMVFGWFVGKGNIFGVRGVTPAKAGAIRLGGILTREFLGILGGVRGDWDEKENR